MGKRMCADLAVTTFEQIQDVFVSDHGMLLPI